MRRQRPDRRIVRKSSHRGPQLRFEPLEPRMLLAAQPLITEFMASNANSITDGSGDSSDWIEVFNNGDMSLDLTGWHVTDDATNLEKWTFPTISLDPGQFLIVFANGTEIPVVGDQLHASIRLAIEGEYLALVRPDLTVAHEFAPEYPPQVTDISYGLAFDEVTNQVLEPMQEGYFVAATPLQENVALSAGLVADTTFSVDRGFYDVPIDVEIATDTTGATIRYTVDGTAPSLTNGTTYTSQIPISSTTTLRAAAFKENYVPTNIDTHTYLFLDDVLTQSANGQAPAGWPNSWGANRVDYGMDPDIVNHPVWGPQLADSLRALPTISIVTDLDHLFHPSTGIYANPGNRGRDWERPTSVELIHADGDQGFQIDAGIRIRGGSSRRTSNAKHSLRLFFRSEYGDAKLRYPLFGDEGAEEFDHIDLRTSSDFSWENGSSRFVFLRDLFSRDSQRDVGQPYTRTRYNHVYINGEYWGIYQTQERAEADYGETYLGGNQDDYDAIKIHRGSEQETFTLEVTDGSSAAYSRLWRLMNIGFDDETYFRSQGLNPDLSPNPNDQVLLDVDNLIDTMLVIFYTGNRDEPLSGFLGNVRPNNIWTLGNRVDGDGFKFFTHDNENSLDDGETDRTGPFTQASLEFKHFNPQTLHQALMANQEYRQRFGDRAQTHFFGGGPLTDAASLARLLDRKNELDAAIVAESARWGDSSRSTPYTKNDWLSAVSVVENFFPGRANRVLSQLRVDGLYPGFVPPTFSQQGGQVDAGFELTMNKSIGTIYYTDDGSDPRLIGGQVNPNALTLEASNPTQSTLIASGSNWRYLDDGSNQGTDWQETTFNDASWNTGASPLGYGDGDEETVVSCGPTEPTCHMNNHITTYFRKTIDVSDTSGYSSLNLRLLRDDGAIVYLNGEEIARSNLPNGPVDYQTSAFSRAAGTDESTNFYDFAVSPSLLQEGQNVIAVELHQFDSQSTDTSFDLELIASGTSNSGDTITIDATTLIRARALDGNNWSALNEALFVVPTDNGIVISEINYNPAAPTESEKAVLPGVDNDDFEFVEVVNSHPTLAANLSGYTLSGGVQFAFPSVNLGPGEYAVVVEDMAVFEQRYGTGLNVLGEWTGRLANDGEQLVLTDGLGRTLLDFEYNDANPWAQRADGAGASLELADIANTPIERFGNHDSWRGSTEFLGSPAAPGAGPVGVVINEILSNPDPTQLETDSIELLNPTATAIDISGAYLTNSISSPLKFAVPAGTIIGPGEFRLFDENDFNSSGGADASDFTLDGVHGDDLWLIVTDGNGQVASFVDDVHVGASNQGESLGRVPNGAGRMVPNLRTTLGSPNSNLRVGPLVITEINYAPGTPTAAAISVDATITAGDLDFLEIHNPTDQFVSLADWRVRGGVDFDFGPLTNIDAAESLVLVSFDPDDVANANLVDAFRTNYGIDATVALVGPYSQQVSDTGERIELQRPGDPPPSEPTVTPRLFEDEVVFDELAPWPTDAGGSGNSVHRNLPVSDGVDGSLWTSGVPTPGAVDFSGAVPGDMTGDQDVTAADIDILLDAVHRASSVTYYDLDGSGQLDDGDVQFLVENLLGTQLGDANLDGLVDAADFTTWNLHRFQMHTTWSTANFNGDLGTDVVDFNLWNQHKFLVGTVNDATTGERVPRQALRHSSVESQNERPIVLPTYNANTAPFENDDDPIDADEEKRDRAFADYELPPRAARGFGRARRPLDYDSLVTPSREDTRNELSGPDLMLDDTVRLNWR